MLPLLDLHDVTVAYDRRPVLWDVDFVLRDPHLVGVVGPNGAGKSTLLNAILGLVPLTSGSVENLRRAAAHIANASDTCRSATASIGNFPLACSTWC